MLQLAPSLCEGQGTLCVLDNIGNFDEKVWRRRNPQRDRLRAIRVRASDNAGIRRLCGG